MSDQQPTSEPSPAVALTGLRLSADDRFVFTLHVSVLEREQADLWMNAWRRAASDLGWVPIGPPVIERVRMAGGGGESSYPDRDVPMAWAASGEVRRPRGTTYLVLSVPGDTLHDWTGHWDRTLRARGYEPAATPALKWLPGGEWVVEGSAQALNWPPSEAEPTSKETP